MFISDLFFKKSCSHDKISPELDCGYCPDCGKLIQNEWYITRCACCGVKLKAMTKNGNVHPQYHYCSNCGGQEYLVEKLEKINFIDINFAVLVKREVETSSQKVSTSSCWEEKTTLKPKLLVQYL